VAALTDQDDPTFTTANFPDTLADHTLFGGLVTDPSFVRHLGRGG